MISATLSEPAPDALGVLRTADRALQVLMAFHDSPEWGVSELARALHFDKSVTQRLLATLARRGFVLSDPRTRRYRLGPAVAVLARVVERGGAVEAVARPAMVELARTSEESVVLSVPHGAAYRCTAAVDADGPVRYSAIVGETRPGYGGASGHAIFAYRSEDEVRALFGTTPLTRYTDATVSDFDGLRGIHAKVREQGVAISHGEYSPGVTAVAAPVWVHGEVIASLTIIGPQERMRTKTDPCVRFVMGASARLSSALGAETERQT